MRTENAHRQSTHAFLAMQGMVAGGLVILYGAYKSIGTIQGNFPNAGTLALTFGTLLLITAVFLLLRARHIEPESPRHGCGVGIAAAVATALIAILMAEFALRLAAVHSQNGISIGGVALLRTWPEERHRLAEILRQATPSGRWDEPYFVYDDQLGWTVGANRISEDRLYASSIEGLRSRTRGERLADRPAHHRVALLGDSYAFSLDVPFEASWGHQLEQILGSETQVLNFGVDGFGIDQILLRLERDVPPFEPDVVLFALNQHDIYRSMGVYAFITNPAWSMPFAKPRFVLDEAGDLVHVNPGLSSPHALLNVQKIEQLPHVDLDLGYHQGSWMWRADWAPYVYRLVTTLSPRYPKLNAALDFNGQVLLNAAMLRRLESATKEMGASFVAVYLPSRDTDERLAHATMAASGLDLADMTPCLESIPLERRRVASGGNHFSGESNLQLARCSAALVGDALNSHLKNPTNSHPAAK